LKETCNKRAESRVIPLASGFGDGAVQALTGGCGYIFTTKAKTAKMTAGELAQV